jgi:hypothetical protein
VNFYWKSNPKYTEREWGDGSSEKTDVSWLRKAALKEHARLRINWRKFMSGEQEFPKIITKA